MATAAELQITEISITNLTTTNSLKASVDIQFNGLITVKGFKIFESAKGAFLGMPSRKAGDNWEDTITFADENTKRLISDAVIKQWGGTPNKSAGRASAFTPAQTAQLAAAKTGAPAKKPFGKAKAPEAAPATDDMPDYATALMASGEEATIFDD